MATRGLRRATIQLCRAAALSRRQTPALALTYRRTNSEAESVSVETERGTNSSVHIQENPYHGIAAEPFPQSVVDILLAPVNEEDIEMTPEGLIYLPEIKYRRILNHSFGPGGWALLPRGEVLHFQNDTERSQLLTREYALYCHGRFVSQAMGEHSYFSKSNIQYGKACEAAKSNALMRCCKDLGVASELWDPQFVREWKRQFSEDVWCENVRTKEKRKLWRRKDSPEPLPYPWKENRTGSM